MTRYTFAIRDQLNGFNSVWTNVSIDTLPGGNKFSNECSSGVVCIVCVGVLEIPKPYRLGTTSRGLTWLRIRWDILGDDVADGYIVCYLLAPSNAEETDGHCQMISGNVHSANVTGLDPCTIYLVNVTCTSKQIKVVFQPSQIARFQTLQTGNIIPSPTLFCSPNLQHFLDHAIAPTTLVQLNCNATSPTSLRLSWTERNASCLPERYRIQYKSDDVIKSLWVQNRTGTEGYRISDLRPWTTYANMSVTPWNQGGPGFKSNVIDCKTEQGGKTVLSPFDNSVSCCNVHIFIYPQFRLILLSLQRLCHPLSTSLLYGKR